MPDTPEEPSTTPDTTVPGAVRRVGRPAIIAIAALSAAVVVAIIVIVALVMPKQGAAPVAAPTSAPGGASATPRPSASATPTPTATATQAPVAAPAPVDPAPADPAPDPGTPALPPPPAPVIPPLSIDAMSANASGACTTSTAVDVTWSASGALQSSAVMNVRSGGGTPVFNQNWEGYSPTDGVTIYIDCTRPLWFFTLTVSSDTATKTGRLTFYNGVSQGWSSVAP